MKAHQTFFMDCHLAGRKYYDADLVWDYLRVGQTLRLERDMQNPHDPNAVAVIAVLPNGTHMKIGYVPKSHNAELARILDSGERTRVRQFAVIGGAGYNYGCEMKVAF